MTIHAAPRPGGPYPCCQRMPADGERVTGERLRVTCPGQVRAHHAPAAAPPDVDLAAVRSPGGEPWARTDAVFARRGGAAERRALLEQQVREQERDDAARRVEAWAASLSDVHEAQIAAAAAEVIRGRR